jgi:hypothetical protein
MIHDRFGSADSGGVADQEVDEPGAAERRLQLDDARLFGPDVPDHGGLPAQRVSLR